MHNIASAVRGAPRLRVEQVEVVEVGEVAEQLASQSVDMFSVDMTGSGSRQRR